LLDEGVREQVLVDIAARVESRLSAARLANTLSVIDAVSFRNAGLGGTAPLDGSQQRFQSRAAQVDGEIQMQGAIGTRTVIKWEELDRLGPQERQFIRSHDTSIVDLFDRWTEERPKRTARDPGVRERAMRELENIKADLCSELNELLDFFAGNQWSLDDHYLAIRHICAR
jgi:hypothetical protein